MKKHLLILALILLGFSVNAADFKVNKLVREYRSYDEVTSITIPRVLFKLALMMGDLEPEEEILLQNIHKLRVLTTEHQGIWNNFQTDFKHIIETGNLVPLLTVSESGQKVYIMSSMKDEEVLHDLYIFSNGDDKAFICLEGDFRIDEISKLTASVNKTMD